MHAPTVGKAAHLTLPRLSRFMLLCRKGTSLRWGNKNVIDGYLRAGSVKGYTENAMNNITNMQGTMEELGCGNGVVLRRKGA